MPIRSLFGGSLALTRHALDLRLERQGLIQSNIANLETPGYQAQDLPFARIMASITAGQRPLNTTHPRHLEVDPATAAMRLEPAAMKGPVDLDEEMVKLAENNLMYQTAARIMAKKYEGIRFAIDEGGK
ncbi:MAG: flagellar basal body rod protein FlgB [Thermodesulfobacteriota bacterium]